MSTRSLFSPIPLSIVLVLLLSALPAVATTTVPEACQPGDHSAIDVKLDTRNGEFEGARSFRVRDQVRAVFTNMNPFVFSYQIGVTATPVEEPGLEAFLAASQLNSLAEIEPPKTEADTEEKGGASADAVLDDMIKAGRFDASADSAGLTPEQIREAIRKKGLLENKRRLDEAWVDLSDKATELERELAKLQGQVKSLRKGITDPDLDCPTLVTRLETLLTALDASALKTKKKTVVDGKNTYRDLIGVQRQALRSFQEEMLAAGVAPATLDRELAELRQNLGRHGRHVDRIDRLIETIDKGLKDLAAVRKSLDTIRKRSGAFFTTRLIGPFLEPTNAQITQKRKKTEEAKFPENPHGQVTLNFGGRQRFALAVGAAYSSLGLTEFQAVQGFERDRGGERVLGDDMEPNLTRVIGIDEDSSERVTPMLALHTRIAPHFWIFDGLHLTLGINGNFTDGATLESLAGLSLSFAEERFFLTLGGYYGRVKTLEGDFFVGAALPEDVAEVPVRNDREWDFGFALTYKVR